MKKFLSLALCFSLLFALVPFSAIAAESEVVIDGVKYKLSDDNTYYIVSSCDTSVTEVTIISEISGIPVTKIGYYAFCGCKSLESVLIPNSVITIDDGAFDLCENIKHIEIPDSVIEIGDDIFYCCYSLTSVVIPNSVTNIGKNAFMGCKSLENVVIPDSVKSIGNNAFFDCTALENIVIPDSVTSLGDCIFYYCDNLESVQIGDSVTSIGEYAFYNCTNLTSIVIPNSVTNIGQSIFQYCDKLKNIYCEADSQPEGWDEYWGCVMDWDFEVYVPISATIHWGYKTEDDDEIKSEVTIDGVSYRLSADETYYIVFDSDKSITEVTIPSKISGVPVTEIDIQAFEDCTNLRNIVIPDSVTEIGSYAFSGCVSLTSIKIPDSVRYIGDEALSYCESLSNIAIPESAVLGSSIFACSYKITYTEYSGGKYYGTESNPYQILYYALSENISIHNNTKQIGGEAFFDKDALTTIAIPNSVITIGDSAFYSCDSLKSIAIPNSLTTIATGAFEDCTSLESITVSKDNKYYHVKDNCLIETATNTLVLGLKNSIIPDYVTSISSYAFSNNKSITSIVIPDSITSIGAYAFKNCDSLESIIIPDSVTEIRGEAFAYCDNLTDIYCEAKAKPEGWNEYWNQEYDWRIFVYAPISATIHWGYVDPNKQPEITTGDVNGNNKIDMSDYVMLKRAYFGTFNFSDEQKIAGDINKNGKIDMSDYVLLKRAYFGTYVIK